MVLLDVCNFFHLGLCSDLFQTCILSNLFEIRGFLKETYFCHFFYFWNFLSKSNGFPRCLHFVALWPLLICFTCLRNLSFQFCFEFMRHLNDAKRYQEILKDTEFRVQSSEIRVQSSEIRVQSSDLTARSSQFRVLNFEL